MIHFTSRHPSGFLEVILFYYVQLKKHDYGYGITNFNYTMFGKYVLRKLRNFQLIWSRVVLWCVLWELLREIWESIKKTRWRLGVYEIELGTLAGKIENFIKKKTFYFATMIEEINSWFFLFFFCVNFGTAWSKPEKKARGFELESKWLGRKGKDKAL